MNPDTQNQQPVQVQNPLNVMQQGEHNIFEVKRHPIGLLGIYFTAGVLIVVLAIVIFGFAPSMFSNYDSKTVMGYGALAFIVITVLVLLFVLVAHVVYWGNRWILTSDSLTQVLQRSLFDKQSSQLSLANLEDITAQQDGILAHIFNYGVLKAETAGAQQSKFVFLFCPNPTYYAQQILNAREQFEQEQRGWRQRQQQPGGVNIGTE